MNRTPFNYLNNNIGGEHIFNQSKDSRFFLNWLVRSDIKSLETRLSPKKKLSQLLSIGGTIRSCPLTLTDRRFTFPGKRVSAGSVFLREDVLVEFDYPQIQIL